MNNEIYNPFDDEYAGINMRDIEYVLAMYTEIPVDEIGMDGRADSDGKCVMCGMCGNVFSETAFEAECGLACEACSRIEAEGILDKAIEYAEAQCEFTVDDFPIYDIALERRCTQEQYGRGDTMSYSPNAYLAFIRHECTNYDQLLVGQFGDGVEKEVMHSELQNRINSMIIDRNPMDSAIDSNLGESTDGEIWRV